MCTDCLRPYCVQKQTHALIECGVQMHMVLLLQILQSACLTNSDIVSKLMDIF